MQFVKKPVIVDAERVSLLLFNAKNNWKDLPDWIKDQYEKGNIIFEQTTITIKATEGDRIIPYPYWIIHGSKGEIYSCRDDIFKETHELAKDKDKDKEKETKTKPTL